MTFLSRSLIKAVRKILVSQSVFFLDIYIYLKNVGQTIRSKRDILREESRNNRVIISFQNSVHSFLFLTVALIFGKPRINNGNTITIEFIIILINNNTDTRLNPIWMQIVSFNPSSLVKLKPAENYVRRNYSVYFALRSRCEFIGR